MPQRRRFAPTPGTIKKACPRCAQAIALSQLGCTSCWKTLPAELQDAWKAVRSAPGEARASAAAAIEAHLREAAPR